MRTSKPVPILLHVCCAPCAAPCIELLLENNRSVQLFFSNSNIDLEAEFVKRLDGVKILAEHYRTPLHIEPYRHDRWLARVNGLEDEPERGKRCSRCFAWSLRRAMIAARNFGRINFTTSLTVSPHKDTRQIFAVGESCPGFEPWDFKKQNGFKRSVELSRSFNLYRQAYCGCEFSTNAPRMGVVKK